MPFNIKPLELGTEEKKAQRNANWRHVGKTILYMAGGVVISLLISYFSEGGNLNNEQIRQSSIIGAFIGLFITNSPCTRGKC